MEPIAALAVRLVQTKRLSNEISHYAVGLSGWSEGYYSITGPVRLKGFAPCLSFLGFKKKSHWKRDFVIYFDKTK